ncbi:MAG: RpiB/LacA/LacB family sugar-phosphate isomerase [Planctomycetota bacterium]
MDPQIEQIVRRVVGRIAAERAGPAPDAAAPAQIANKTDCSCSGEVHKNSDSGKAVVDAAQIAIIADGGILEIGNNTIVTPLAADLARERNITIQRNAGCAGTLTIAIGSDHGGFHLKQSLKLWLSSLGHRVLDQGTHNDSACDYPDFALAVAKTVASGAARFGVMIDGAGIGSSMAGNRVAGVLAALCSDAGAAKNAREHNYANMLTMGAKNLSEGKAKEIVHAFLTTPEGAERHKKRVDKIRALDQIR